MSFDPTQYAVGDVIKVTQTFKVASTNASRLKLEDVKSGEDCYFYPTDDSVRVEMVKRAARPKPKAGDVLFGDVIGKIQWKRGTAIRCVRGASGKYVGDSLPALVLFADGKWHDVEGFSSYEFEDLNQEAGFEILYVA